MFKSIIRAIFGERIYFEDPILGELETTIRSEDPLKNRSWIGWQDLPNVNDGTFFALEGNINGPSSEQLKAVHCIIKELDSIKELIDIELKRTEKEYSKIENWKEDFYLGSVGPYDTTKQKFEISFSLQEDDSIYIGCIWAKGKITEVEAKF